MRKHVPEKFFRGFYFHAKLPGETTPTKGKQLHEKCYHAQVATAIRNRMQAMAAEVDAMIRGCQVYRDIWSTVVDKQLTGNREPFNPVVPFAVAVSKGVPSLHMPCGYQTHS